MLCVHVYVYLCPFAIAIYLSVCIVMLTSVHLPILVFCSQRGSQTSSTLSSVCQSPECEDDVSFNTQSAVVELFLEVTQAVHLSRITIQGDWFILSPTKYILETLS